MALLSQPSAVVASGAIGNKNGNSGNEAGAIADAETGASYSSSGGYITAPDDGAIHVQDLSLQHTFEKCVPNNNTLVMWRIGGRCFGT